MAETDREAELESLDWRKLGPAIDAAIDGLREEDRRIVLLRYFDRRPFVDVAMTSGVSEDAARMRVQRALEKMQGSLRKQGITSTAAALGVALADNAVLGAPAGLAGTVAAATVASAPVAASVGIFVGIGGVLLFPGAGILALILAALGTAEFEFFAARAERGSLAGAQLAYAKAVAGEQSDQRKLATALKAANKPSEVAAPAERDPKAEGAAFLLRHPEVKDALKAYKSATMRSEYNSLWRSLNLSEEQIEQFEQIMYPSGFGRSVQDGSIQLDENDQKLTPQERREQLRALLGESGYQAMVAFTRTANARETTTSLAALMTGTEAPLSSGQAQQLTAILGASPALAAAGDEDWSKIASEAQAILSGPQLEMLSSLRVHAVGWQKVHQAAGH